jgi:putative OPT family oligopeptide transporter
MAAVDDKEGLGKTYEYKPYVPEETDLKELTFKALFIGVLMAIVLGAANAYLGLRAGITVAATFPAAAVGMAVLRFFKGTILEENIARTTGAVGEALVAGAIFTIPAFVITKVWAELNYWEATALMLVGGILGAMFVILLRRILVEESGLQFPESIAAAELHKAGQKGGTGAVYVFGAMGLSALFELLKNSAGVQVFKEYITWAILPSAAAVKDKVLGIYNSANEQVAAISTGGGSLIQTPSASPAYWGVGYIIGPRLASITFSGGLIAWALLVPLILLFSPDILSYAGADAVKAAAADASQDVNTWLAVSIWSFAVRPLAVGAMIVAAIFTLWKMRKQLTTGIARAVGDVFKAAGSREKLLRTQTDLPFKLIFGVVAVLVVVMAVLYYYFSQDIIAAVTAAVVMAVAGFFFAAVAGYLVGLIGSSNNPISGLTLSTLIVAALLILAFGVPGRVGETAAILAVLGVASVVCCSCGVAGDMMQDLKVGHILGGTPWRMEIGKVVGVIFAAFVMTIPLIILHEGYKATGGIGGTDLPAPQAGLMAMLSRGIITQNLEWPLVIVGMFFALGLILIKSPSPMLIAVGMYLPLHTTFAMFVGGVIRWSIDRIVARRKYTDEKKGKVENVGILLASGLIAGEALMAIILAGFVFFDSTLLKAFGLQPIVTSPEAWPGILAFIVIAFVLVYLPLRGAKRGGPSATTTS